jgi:membrane-associated phospholipid phosphatase
VAVLYSLGLIVLCVAFRGRIPGWPYFVAGHALILLATQLLVGASSAAGRFARAFDMCAYIPALFLMACPLIHRVHPTDYDAELIEIDRAIGGIAVLRGRVSVEAPWLTWVAKVAWISYYFVALVPGIALYRRPAKRAFEEAKLVFMLGWLVSYALYFAVPAEGPGYHATEIGVPQPVWEGSALAAKRAIYALEGDARDTFPSGHVIIAALVIFTCLRNRLWGASLVGLPVSLAIIGSTLYLRYHYLIDVLAGLAVAAFCALFGVWWYRKYDEGKIGL